ncbi:hypothetical protein AAHH78_36980, partial [Burkholderia pseudomallei]
LYVLGNRILHGYYVLLVLALLVLVALRVRFLVGGGELAMVWSLLGQTFSSFCWSLMEMGDWSWSLWPGTKFLCCLGFGFV